MKTLFLLAFFLTILGIKCIEDLECPSSSSPVPTSKRLHNYLFCEYDSTIRPSLKRENSTIIHFRITPQYVEFEEETNTLSLSTWVDASWRDQHLTWEPEKWDNLQSISVKSYEIWTPSLTVFNHGDLKESYDGGMATTDCLLTYNGSVKCVTPTKYKSHCPTEYDEWPFDKHNCTIHIGVWMFELDEIRFKFDENSINMTSFRANSQWNVHVAKKTRTMRYRMGDDEGELSIAIEVFMQRHGSRLAIVYILPIIVLTTLTMIVLWLDSQSLERTFVACVNFICHLLALSDLHWYFPTKGSITTPKILLFHEASVALSAFALIFTCLLRKLRSLNVSAPMWIVSATSFVINSPISPYFGLALNRGTEAGILDETPNNEETKPIKDRTWRELATILERLSFAIVFLTYVIIIGIVIPPKEPAFRDDRYWR